MRVCVCACSNTGGVAEKCVQRRQKKSGAIDVPFGRMGGHSQQAKTGKGLVEYVLGCSRLNNSSDIENPIR